MLTRKEHDDADWLIGLCYPRGKTAAERAALRPAMLEAVNTRMTHRSEEFREKLRKQISYLWA